jgi:hypothetical protein
MSREGVKFFLQSRKATETRILARGTTASQRLPARYSAPKALITLFRCEITVVAIFATIFIFVKFLNFHS